MTQQIQDKLIFEGKEYYLNNEILEYYFEEFPNKKPETNIIMTACWKGYFAIFEIIDNELIIKKIDWLDWDEVDDKKKLKFDLFPNDKYSWFTGFIRIDNFRGKFDDENDKNGIFELLEFNNGNLVNQWKLLHNDFIEFKEILFEDFKKTSKYDKIFSKWKSNNPNMKQYEIEKHIFKYIINYINR